MIKTFNLEIYTDKGTIYYLNISRTAVKHFLNWYREDKGYRGANVSMA